jgi:hypothetical protein
MSSAFQSRYKGFQSLADEETRDEAEYYRLRPYIAIGSDPFKDENGNRIPKDALEFYEDFGPIIHPRTGEPVEKPSWYQLLIWNDGWIYKLRLAVKTHRAGVSQTGLYEDVQKAMTVCRGHQILIVMQTEEQANHMLYRLRKGIQASERYSKYLINKQNEFLFKQEVSKSNMIYLNNPDSEIHPTVIMAKGVSEGSLWSLEKVKHVHMSDIAAARVDYAPAITSAGVRMATTDGTMLIESPPQGGTKGKLYDLWKESKAHQNELARIHEKINAETMEGHYKLYEITWREAIAAGVMSEAYLRQAKKTMTPQEFASYHEAQFVDTFGDLFDYEAVIACENRGRIYGLHELIDSEINFNTVKSVGYDPGHGSSKYAICALEWLPITMLSAYPNAAGPGILRVIYCHEFDKKLHTDMVNKVVKLYNRIGARKIYGGAVNPEILRDIKIAIGEDSKYERLVDRARTTRRPVEKYMNCVPIPETVAGPELNSQAKAWVESGFLAVHPESSGGELTRQMKNAVTKPNGQLDKSVDNYDSLDSFKNALRYFRFNAAQGIGFGHVFRFADSIEESPEDIK